ncbi:MAG: CHAT domain-containing protein [Bacteroidota bacterium]
MPGKPVIWLHFANTAELPELPREENEIRKAFADLHDAGIVEVICRHQLEIEEIFEEIERYGDRIQIIHLAGHSDAEYVQLTSGDRNSKARAQGLGNRFGQLNALVLVFLNGCKNLAQVERMLAAGVKGVIATSESVGDDSASLFSAYFYKQLSEGATINTAFQRGKNYLESKGDRPNPHREIRIYRDLTNHSKDTHDFPWGLYLYQPNSDQVLQWKVPPKRIFSRSQIWIILGGLVALGLLLFGLFGLGNRGDSSEKTEVFLIHNGDTLATEGFALIGDGSIGFDRDADHFSADQSDIPEQPARNFFELLPPAYEIDSISYSGASRGKLGLHVSEWVDTTLQIIRRSCLLRKELHSNWETQWDQDLFEHVRGLDFNVETGILNYEVIQSQRDKEFALQLYRDGDLNLNLKVNSSRRMICFAVVGGQIWVGKDQQLPSEPIRVAAKVIRQNHESQLSPLKTNDQGQFFAVIPYRLLPGTVRGYNPNAEFCMRDVTDSTAAWSCFPISRSIVFSMGGDSISGP